MRMRGGNELLEGTQSNGAQAGYLGNAVEVLLAVVARLRLEQVPVEAEPNQVEPEGLAGRNNSVRDLTAA